ncbi:MAG TPA: LysR family transcriptional regulator [Polyangiaceae bacterium]|nr:LysR family transcriptional regulator [Polyangiaceae bacterium]
MDALSHIDLNWLRSLSLLLETRSVSAAARRAGVGQPAMSRTLAHLRRVLGDPLLVQSGRGSRLTEHAESLKPRVEDALVAVQAALRAPAHFDPKQEHFELRIAANDYMHSALLSPWLAGCRSAAPGMRLNLQPIADASIALLAAGELDFVIGPAVQKPSLELDRFVARPLWSDEYVCAMRAGHPCAKGRFDLQRLRAAEYVRVVCGNFSSACDAALAKHAPDLRVTATVYSFLQALNLVRDSNLLALVPARLVAIERDVSTRKLPFEAAAFRIYLAWHPRLTGNSRHRWARERLLAHAASAPVRQ